MVDYSRKITQEQYTAWFKNRILLDENAGYSNIKIPMLAICGKKEIKEMIQSIAELGRRNPNCKTIFLDNANHDFPLRQAKLINPILLEFINDIFQMKGITGGVESVPGMLRHDLKDCGGPLSVYEAGDTGKPKVVMLHGAMYDETRFIWDQLFPFLSKDYHLFALDIPRHGRSRPWEGKLDHSRLMDIMHNAFEQLGLDQFSLVGLSMGGALSIEYASLYPDKVKSMVLFEPGGLGDKVDLEFITWLYIKIPGMLKLFSQNYRKKDNTGMKKILESLYVGGSKPTDPDRLILILKDEVKGKYDHRENDMDDWQLNCIGPFRLKWNLLDRIPLIKCPTLWLRGAESVLVKQHEMERAVKLAINSGTKAELNVIPNAGHMLPLEQPEQANAAVKAFLDRMSV